MTPSETTEQRTPSSMPPSADLVSLIAACGRDERPALKALYELTAADLYGRAVAATSARADADHALVQTYLAVFAEAERFDPATIEPRAWLAGILGRHLPVSPVGGCAGSVSSGPVEPPAELWQKLDIGLGLQRLDRHIKPGIATQERGRDPMPNAHDRQIERQLRFWRVASGASFSALVLAAGLIGAMVLQEGPSNPRESSAEVPVDRAAAEPVPPGSPRLAILRADEDGRVWRVDIADDGLRVRPLPPFAAGSADGRPGVLALWAELDPAGGSSISPAPAAGGEMAEDNSPVPEAEPALVRLADLDPATTTHVPLPDAFNGAALGDHGIELLISLEPIDRTAAIEPLGPVLFSGRLEP